MPHPLSAELLAPARLLAGVQGEQHLHLHLGGEPRLLLRQCRHPRQDYSQVPGEVRRTTQLLTLQTPIGPP